MIRHSTSTREGRIRDPHGGPSFVIPERGRNVSTLAGFPALMLVMIAAGCGRGPATGEPASRPARETTAAVGPGTKLEAFPCLDESEIPISRYREIWSRCEPVENMSIPNLLHLLRLRGIDPEQEPHDLTSTDGDSRLTSRQILARLTNEQEFQRIYHLKRPFVISTSHGARFSEKSLAPDAKEKATREAHVGQALCALAEVGVPLNTTVITDQETTTLAAVVNDAVANFTFDQELYWLAVAFAVYLPPERTNWRNKFDEDFDFDSLSHRLMQHPPGRMGPCGGMHALYALAVLLQVADNHPRMLRDETRRAILKYESTATQALIESQAEDGSWDADWSRSFESRDAAGGGRAESRNPYAPEQSRRPRITGHVLEWQAVAGRRAQLPHDRLVRAVEYVLNETIAVPAESLRDDACAYTHGIRAVKLLVRLHGPVTPERLGVAAALDRHEAPDLGRVGRTTASH